MNSDEVRTGARISEHVGRTADAGSGFNAIGADFQDDKTDPSSTKMNVYLFDDAESLDASCLKAIINCSK